ncbi:hypothetical protein ACJX0J_017723 [Zea mays]
MEGAIYLLLIKFHHFLCRLMIQELILNDDTILHPLIVAQVTTSFSSLTKCLNELIKDYFGIIKRDLNSNNQWSKNNAEQEHDYSVGINNQEEIERQKIAFICQRMKVNEKHFNIVVATLSLQPNYSMQLIKKYHERPRNTEEVTKGTGFTLLLEVFENIKENQSRAVQSYQKKHDNLRIEKGGKREIEKGNGSLLYILVLLISFNEIPGFLERIQGDICGPIQPLLGPFRYFMVLIDASSKSSGLNHPKNL